MSSTQFHVVVFEDEDSTAVVPNIWLRGTGVCLWPPYKESTRMRSAVQKEEIPGKGWSSHKVRILYSGSLENARKKLCKSVATSDLQSDPDEQPCKRRKNPPKRLLSEECEADSEGTEEEMEDEEGETASQVTPRRGTPVTIASLQYPTPPPRIEQNPTSPPPRIDRSPRLPPRMDQTPRSEIQTPTPPCRIDRSPGTTVRVDRVHEVRDVRLFTMLEKMQEQIRENTRMLQLLVNRYGQLPESVSNQLPEGVSLPLKTQEDLDVFEDIFLNQQSASSVVKYLAQYGGSDVYDTVARILKHVMATELARNYNFSGTKGKQKFETLNLSDIIYRCLHLNPLCRTSSRKNMEGAIQKWLSGARDRDGGRKERMRVEPVTRGDNDPNPGPTPDS